MSASPHDLLFQALEKRFDDGSRRSVLVIGAGLHHHLKATSDDPAHKLWRFLTSWNGLLAETASRLKLPAVLHEDPAATWESLVSRVAFFNSKTEGEAIAVNVAEDRVRVALSDELDAAPCSTEQMRELGLGLMQYRDVVSLNIDESLATALDTVGTHSQVSAPHTDWDTLTHAMRWEFSARASRLWHPHGCTRSPQSIVLGTRAYGKALNRLHSAWDSLKATERKWEFAPQAGHWTRELADQWWAFRRRLEPHASHPLTWLDLFLGSDLVFIGTGLDRAETDLWWALHMRQRNLARVTPSERPGTFVLFEKGLCPSHLASSPAGVTPVIFQSWQEAWDMILPGGSAAH